jgi:hypothetical protein
MLRRMIYRAIFPRLAILLALALPFGPARADSAPEVRIVASAPSLPARLGRNEPVYLRLSYRSAIPLRVQARGFFRGEDLTNGVRYNPSPAYPAGDGEAMVWLSYSGPTRIDQVRVEICDGNWKTLKILALPVDVVWSSAAAPVRPQPAWVERLNAGQQNPAGDGDSGTAAGFADWLTGLLLGVGIPGYFVLQIVLAIRYSGGWRVAALAPLAIMLPAMAHAAFALSMQSNLWPLLVVLSAPFLFLYLCALIVARWLVRMASG